MGGLRISVHGSKELQAVIIRMKGVEKEAASAINKETRSIVEPIWKEAVAANVSGRLEAKVLANTARAAVGRGNVTLKSAGIGRALSGGGRPPDLMHVAEFGADRAAIRQTTRGKRHTQRQFKARNQKGYVVYPAAAEVIPRIASLWVQTVVKAVYKGFEGR